MIPKGIFLLNCNIQISINQSWCIRCQERSWWPLRPLEGELCLVATILPENLAREESFLSSKVSAGEFLFFFPPFSPFPQGFSFKIWSSTLLFVQTDHDDPCRMPIVLVGDLLSSCAKRWLCFLWPHCTFIHLLMIFSSEQEVLTDDILISGSDTLVLRIILAASLWRQSESGLRYGPSTRGLVHLRFHFWFS